jgi:hypothetical protein
VLGRCLGHQLLSFFFPSVGRKLRDARLSRKNNKCFFNIHSIFIIIYGHALNLSAELTMITSAKIPRVRLKEYTTAKAMTGAVLSKCHVELA